MKHLSELQIESHLKQFFYPAQSCGRSSDFSQLGLKPDIGYQRRISDNIIPRDSTGGDLMFLKE